MCVISIYCLYRTQHKFGIPGRSLPRTSVAEKVSSANNFKKCSILMKLNLCGKVCIVGVFV